MKKSTKILSVFLALIMMFSMAMPSFAAVKSNVTTVEGLVATDSLCSLVEWLLTNLNARKEKFVPTVLTFAERYVEDIAAFIPAGKTVDSLSDEQKAEVLLNYLDNMLSGLEMDLSDISNITELIGITLDLSSVNGVLATLGSVTKSILISETTAGDANEIVATMFVYDSNLISTTYVNRSNTSDLGILYKLFEFLSNSKNVGVIKKALSGTLELGAVEQFWNPDEEASFLEYPDGSKVAGGLNGSMKYLPTYIKNMVYDGLIDEPEMIAKVDRNWTIDEILGYAFLNLITDKTDITKAEATEVMTSSAYANLLKYAPVLYANFAVEPLNTSFKGVLTDLGNSNAAFKAIINTDYTFTEADFSALGLTAEAGVLGGFNNMVYVVLSKIMTTSAFNELALEKGATAEKLNSNLTKFCRYILPKLGKIDDFDFTKFTAAVVKNMSLEDMAVQVLKIFYPGWFHISDANTLSFVNSIDTMPEMLAAAAYFGFPDDYYGSRAGYAAILMTADGKAVNSKLTEEACVELALDILMDKAVYELDYAKENTLFDMPVDKVKSYKEAGWNWEDFADEIVDWALNMVKGVPAVTDHLTTVRGIYDGNGPFNKLNAIVNEIINFNFMSNVSSTAPNGKVMSVIDFETFLMDGVIGNFCDFDIAGVLGLFAVNSKSGNILNENFTKSAIGIVDKALEAIFNHSCSNTSYTVNATCVTAGEKVEYCANNGHINKVTVYPATNKHTKDAGTITKAATCTAKGEKIYKCTVCNQQISKEVLPIISHNYISTGSRYTDSNGNICQKMKCTMCGDTKVNIFGPDTSSPKALTAASASVKIAGDTVEGFKADTTVAALKNSFKEKSHIVIKDSQGNVLKDNAIITTGTIVSLVVNNKEVDKLEVAVLGDIDCDGVVSSSDARLALRQSVKLESLSGAKLLAADVADDIGAITSADARLILRQAVKLENFSRVF